MKGFSDHLDAQTELLIAVGAAVACGCEPCLRKLLDQAGDAAVDPQRLRSAAIIGQFVKDQPVAQMRNLADELLGTHLSRSAGAARGCPVETRGEATAGGCRR